MNDFVIKTNKLSKTYKLCAEEIHAVNEVDLDISAGDFVAIMGPSGSGKTTLLDMLGCLDRTSNGSLEVLGNDISKASENKLADIRRGKIGLVFQDFSLIPSLTALENVELAQYFAGQKRDRKKAHDILDAVSLGKRINHLPKQLSGGEKQRVAIARALITQPQILIADEPTGHLDTVNAKEIFDLFSELNEKSGLTIILATHNQKLGSLAKRQIFIQDGKLVN